MCRFVLVVIVVTLLSGSVVQGASYQKTDGTIVDPILDTFGSPLYYSGNTLGPAAKLLEANLHQALLPSAMPSLPVVNGASPLTVSGSVQVDSGGNLLVTSDTFTTTGIDMQGGKIQAAIFGLELDQIGDISGHGQLFGHVDLGTSGTIAGSGAELELFGYQVTAQNRALSDDGDDGVKG